MCLLVKISSTVFTLALLYEFRNTSYPLKVTIVAPLPPAFCGA